MVDSQFSVVVWMVLKYPNKLDRSPRLSPQTWSREDRPLRIYKTKLNTNEIVWESDSPDVYYESIKRELNKGLKFDSRCDARLRWENRTGARTGVRVPGLEMPWNPGTNLASPGARVPI